MTAERLVLRLKSVKCCLLKHDSNTQAVSWTNKTTIESFEKLWDMDRLVKKEQDYQSRYRVENKLTLYLHYYGVGMWFIAADKLVGSRGNLT